jgi:peptide chain release factor subunit 1
MAYVGIAHGPRRTILFKVDTNLATNTRRGGSSAARYGRIRDEQRHNYRKKLVDACASHLQNVEGIVFAGNAELPGEVKELVENDKRLSVPILGLLKVSNEMSFDEIVERSLELIQTDDIVNEKAVISDIEDLIRRDPDMLVFGRDIIGKCIDEGLIHYVVVNEQEFPFDIDKRTLVHSTFLNPYDGVIGVLYYSGSSSYLV